MELARGSARSFWRAEPRKGPVASRGCVTLQPAPYGARLADSTKRDFKLRTALRYAKLGVFSSEVLTNVPASSDKLSALAEANRRNARLAISWFAVDANRVEVVLRAV